MKSLEEYISSTPQIAEDGGIVLGTKKSSAFLVDAKTGRVIHTYRISDPPSTAQSTSNEFPHNATTNKQSQSESSIKNEELPLYITRTDYTLTSFLPNSDKVLWNVTVAEIGAAFLCQDVEKSLSDTLPDESSDPDLPHNMPLPCQSRALVFRFRNQNMFEALSSVHGPSKGLHHDRMLAASTADVLPSQLNVGKVLEILPFRNSGDKVLDTHDSKDLKGVRPLKKGRGISDLLVVFVFVALLVGFVYHYRVASRTTALAGQATGTSYTNLRTKKKKSRKAGKTGSNDGKHEKEDNEAQPTDIESNFWMNLNPPLSYKGDGRTIGKLVVSSKEIAKGSNGTIVLEGIYEGRPVAVKRLVRAYNDIAIKEIQNLIVSDRHLNIVRWYGVEQDQDFVYLALERCACSLNDLISMHSRSPNYPTFGNNVNVEATAEFTVRPDSMDSLLREFELWNSDGYPSPLLLKLMRSSNFFAFFHRHTEG